MSEHTDETIIRQLRETVERQAEELAELRRTQKLTSMECYIMSGFLTRFEAVMGKTVSEFLEEQRCPTSDT